MSVVSFSHIEFYVSNLPCTQFLFNYGFGFKNNLLNNLFNKSKNVSFICQNDIKIILNSSDNPISSISKEFSLSGDFIKDVAFEVDDIEKIITNAESLNIKIIEPIQELQFENQVVFKKATIAAFGNTNHTLIQRVSVVSDNFDLLHTNPKQGDLEKIDHIAVAVESKNLYKWTNYYEKVFGLKKIFEENITTENSGMNSVVVGDEEKGIKIVLVSPVDGKSRSQINDFIINNNGEGVQHLAFSTSDIINAVQRLKDKGIEFLDINDDYYLKLDLPNNYENTFKDALKDNKILYDKDEYGELLQIFSKKLHTKPTWFIEIIERKGAKTFGKGNIKKLYESVEKELSK